MSYPEKRSIVYFISTMVLFGIYFIYMFQSYDGGAVTEENALTFLAPAVLLLVPAHIIVNVVLEVILTVITTIVTKEEEDPSFADERDKLIELKSTRNAYATFMIGFLLALGSLVIGMSELVMFNLLVVALLVAQLVWNFSQLYFYRRGY